MTAAVKVAIPSEMSESGLYSFNSNSMASRSDAIGVPKVAEISMSENETQ